MAPRRGLVLGCGGTVGGAWTVGALAAVAHRLDWDPRTAELVVGTSSGASIAAMLGAGVSVDELVDAQHDRPGASAALRRFFTHPPGPYPPVPRPALTSAGLALRGLARRNPLAAASGLAPLGRGDTAFLRDLADALTRNRAWVEHPGTWIIAADLASGQRVAFGRAGAPTVPLSYALRASWAVPAWYPPVSAHGRSYADGGILSPCSADLVAEEGLDEVVLIAPMVSVGPHSARGIGARAEALLRSPMSAIADREVAALGAAGVKVLRVHPDAIDLAAMGANFMDPRNRRSALDAAARHVPGRLEDVRR